VHAQCSPLTNLEQVMIDMPSAFRQSDMTRPARWLAPESAMLVRGHRLSKSILSESTFLLQAIPFPAVGSSHGRAHLCGECRALDFKKRWLALKKGTPPVQCRCTEPRRKKGYRVSPPLVQPVGRKGVDMARGKLTNWGQVDN